MTRFQILALLASDSAAVERGIVAIFHGQTEDEKCDNSTHHTNGRGFNYKDADYGSYLARWVISGRHLTGKHLAAARRMCNHYVRQLVELSEKKLAADTLTVKVSCPEMMSYGIVMHDPFQALPSPRIRVAG